MSPSQISAASTAELVAFYNARAAVPVKKFADRKTAVRRCLALVEAPVTTSKGRIGIDPATGAVTVVTKAGATVVTRPAAGTSNPATKARPAKVDKPAADKKTYVLGDVSAVKRGAIFDAVTKLAKRKSFTRPDFCAACGGEVNALSHFYWSRRHGVVVEQ